jgi:uncharacterized membrane protein YkvA (DUF1232 family)
MSSTYSVEKMGEKVISLTAVDGNGFISREIVTREEAEQLLRKLIIVLYAERYQTGPWYTSVVLNGLMYVVNPSDPDELAARQADERADDAEVARVGLNLPSLDRYLEAQENVEHRRN